MVVASSKVGTRRQVTLPKQIQRGLRVEEGERLTWLQVADGIAILSKGAVTREQIAERLLASLVVSVGSQAESKGIRDEETLDGIAKGLRKRSFEARYAHRQV